MTDKEHRKVVIIGGGMLGLTMAQRLSGSRDITLLEASPTLGGLVAASSFDTPRGPVEWDLFYHVVLSQDTRVLALLQELDLDSHITMETVHSELLDADNVVHPMSSVLDLVRLPVLPPLSRLRVGATIAAGAVLPINARAERITAAQWVRRWSGDRAYRALWQPLLAAKLGHRADEAASTFLRATYRRLLQARLRGGTGDRFGWLHGGYPTVLAALEKQLRQRGIELRTDVPVTSINRVQDSWVVHSPKGTWTADEIILTTPGSVSLELLERAAASCVDAVDDAAFQRVRAGLAGASYLGVICVSALLERKVTGAYLTYVTAAAPYTGIIEMTNLTGPEAHKGYHLVYLPRYVTPDDALFDAADEEISQNFIGDLISRYPQLSASDVVATRVARARHVMPVPTTGWRDRRPSTVTGLPGIYLSSSAQVPDGTLNVDTTLRIASEAASIILGDGASPDTRNATQ